MINEKINKANQFKILYDINHLNIDNKAIQNIMIKYNKFNNKECIINDYAKLFYDDRNKTKLIDIIINKYINLFENIKNYNIIESTNIDYIINLFKK